MTPRLQKLHDALVAKGFSPRERLNELTLEVPATIITSDWRGEARGAAPNRSRS